MTEVYERQTKEELIMRLTKLNQLPTKDELNEEISRLRIALREEKMRQSCITEKNINKLLPNIDQATRGYLYLLEENSQLHKELENCRDLIDEYIKGYPQVLQK